MQPMEWLNWIMQNKGELLRDLGLGLVAAKAVIHALQGLTVVATAVAKKTPGDADDNAAAKVAKAFNAAENGLDWAYHTVTRFGMRDRSAGIANSVSSIPPPDPRDKPTNPERPRGKS